MAYSVVNEHALITADVSTAFMYAPVEADALDLVLLLWFQELQRTILKMGGSETFEVTLFRLTGTHEDRMLVLVYVDDFLISSTSGHIVGPQDHGVSPGSSRCC